MSNTSKFLSLVLRHKPETIGITIDKTGYVDVDVLLKALEQHNKPLTFDELKNIVDTNDKKRFSFNSDFTKIKANQGHSVEVKLELKKAKPESFLYHGTINDFIPSIMKNGLVKGKRHHVHLSQDIETATKVGSRRGKPIILQIDARHMYADGYKFYISDNNVWLTDTVPPKYIKQL